MFKLSRSRCWDYAGVIVRYDPSTNSGILFYVNQWLTYDPYNYVTFSEIVNGAVVKYQYVRVPLLQYGYWYELKVRVVGDTYTGYINGKEYLRYTAVAQFTSGRVALWAYRGDQPCLMT